MKLKELLEIIPDECDIGLSNFSKGNCKVTYGNREYAILSFAEREKFITEQVENMDVISICPCAKTYCTDELMFGDDMPSLHVNMQLLIEIV
jgi:hypothetical protein